MAKILKGITGGQLDLDGDSISITYPDGTVSTVKPNREDLLDSVENRRIEELSSKCVVAYPNRYIVRIIEELNTLSLYWDELFDFLCPVRKVSN
ncbi:MAG TPA: hypothetical protein VFI61_01900 [Patescibacteria group bacterium]|nr:hypothetical protein [Patescibacteria group bacterium]